MAIASVSTFLMFTGQAEEAMNWYVSLFPNSRIISIKRYGKNETGPEGSVMVAEFSLSGHPMMCTDNPGKQPFTFNPSMSIYVNFDDDAEIERLCKSLSQGGEILMPLNKYFFSKKYAWVSDRYGVSWQLNLK